jgi:hypothetical protein
VPGGASELGLTLRCALSILEQDAATETPKRPDQVLWTAVWGLSAVQRGLDRLLYRWQARRFFGFPDNANQYFNYLYVSEWFVIFAGLSTLQAFVGSGLWVTALVAALVLWRGSEIIVWYAKMLLDWGHKLLLSAERNLLFLIANTAEMAWILALLISLHTHSLRESWISALTLVTLNPQVDVSGWVSVATVVGTIASLTLLIAGLAVVLGIIGDRFRHVTLPYEGSTRPPRPPWLSRSPVDPNDRIPQIPR